MSWCPVCKSEWCPGCWEPEEETLPDSLDARDATRRPPVQLDPRWVLLMRRRLDRFRETGRVDWFRLSLLEKIASQTQIERISHVSHP